MNFIQNLLRKENMENSSTNNIVPLCAPSGVEKGNMYQMGYQRAGRNNGDPIALKGSFNAIKSGQIVDESNNEQKKREAIDDIDKKIEENRISINENKAAIEKIDNVELPSLERQITENRENIEQLKKGSREIKYKRNKFNLILTWIGFVVGFIYLYLFYVSAIHSAIFRNIALEASKADQNSVGALLNCVFDTTAFKEFNIHWFAPIVFFIFALILHFSLEIRYRFAKWPIVTLVASFVLIADGMLAYAIEKNNHIVGSLMGLSEGQWVFYKSFVFYLVLFFGFFTSMGWSIVLHKLACEFESGNPERKSEEEIHGIEKNLRQLYVEKGNLGSARIERFNAIRSLEDRIESLDAKKNHIFYSTVELEMNVDDFYNGWLSYLSGLKSEIQKKHDCENIYVSFKSEHFNRSLTA